MTCESATRRRNILTRAAFALAFVSIVAGSLLCMVKSPQARGASYVAAAADRLAKGDSATALDLAYEALRHDPASAQNWNFYAVLMEKNGRIHAAGRARRIALSLQHGVAKAEPLYAMPATLRLSFLADHGITP